MNESTLGQTSQLLYVEDDETLCVLFERYYKKFDFDITIAKNVASANEKLANSEFDLLLVDKNLPDGSGMEVIEEMRRLGHDSEVIVFTGYSNLQSAVDAMKYRVYRYVIKPMDLELLTMELTGALETKALRDSLRHDSQELKEINEGILQREKRYKGLIESLPCIVIEFDSSQKPIFVNRFGLESTGYGLYEFCEHFQDKTLFRYEDQSRASRLFADAFNGKDLDGNIFKLKDIDGIEIPVKVRSSALSNDSNPSGFCAVMFDITDPKSKED